MGGIALTGSSPAQLSNQPIMNQIACQAVQQVADDMKSRAGRLDLDFEDLSALIADLKTIDAQLDSSIPKTAIIRECLRSLKEILEGSAESEILVKVKGLLGE